MGVSEADVGAGWVHPAATGSGPWGFNGLNPILVYGKDPYLQEGMGRRPDHLVLAADREGEDAASDHEAPEGVVLADRACDHGAWADDP